MKIVAAAAVAAVDDLVVTAVAAAVAAATVVVAAVVVAVAVAAVVIAAIAVVIAVVTAADATKKLRLHKCSQPVIVKSHYLLSNLLTANVLHLSAMAAHPQASKCES